MASTGIAKRNQFKNTSFACHRMFTNSNIANPLDFRIANLARSMASGSSVLIDRCNSASNGRQGGHLMMIAHRTEFCKPRTEFCRVGKRGGGATGQWLRVGTAQPPSVPCQCPGTGKLQVQRAAEGEGGREREREKVRKREREGGARAGDGPEF